MPQWICAYRPLENLQCSAAEYAAIDEYNDTPFECTRTSMYPYTTKYLCLIRKSDGTVATWREQHDAYPIHIASDARTRVGEAMKMERRGDETT